MQLFTAIQANFGKTCSGFTAHQDIEYFNALGLDYNSTLMITSLRHPVERVISEVRWLRWLLLGLGCDGSRGGSWSGDMERRSGGGCAVHTGTWAELHVSWAGLGWTSRLQRRCCRHREWAGVAGRQH
jgi:hypothetical protein